MKLNKIQFRILIAGLIIVLGVSSYFGYNMIKTYSFNQKIDSLIGQYSMTKSDRPFQEVLRASVNPRQVYSFDDFKNELAKAKSDFENPTFEKLVIYYHVYYNTNERVIYFTYAGSRLTNGIHQSINYMVYYID